MNNILKTIALSAAVLLSAAACSKWTEQQPVDFNYLTIEDKNPELYAAYMQSIRDYHATEHQVLIARYDNKAGVPAGRADHPRRRARTRHVRQSRSHCQPDAGHVTEGFFGHRYAGSSGCHPGRQRDGALRHERSERFRTAERCRGP